MYKKSTDICKSTYICIDRVQTDTTRVHIFVCADYRHMQEYRYFYRQSTDRCKSTYICIDRVQTEARVKTFL